MLILPLKSPFEVLVFKLVHPPKIANQQLREMKWVGPDRIIFLVGNRWRCGDSEVCISACEDSHPTNKMNKIVVVYIRFVDEFSAFLFFSVLSRHFRLRRWHVRCSVGLNPKLLAVLGNKDSNHGRRFLK